ncbi:phosphonate metabolism protein/1,5-bisphosphokinase (PRPP-forming) PhnN [Aureimonas mangrovi]|uniref:phosphonate metabolism protein/1,5-bisphosphokinase (PRPP-forming) PhnN n=1 Tax=Aureimonas mangrovi TaxID=2758041 RepID=UPI00163DB6BA|nr:phosphonate metabolism protein/1,5-bisphosphokinase (PRPP-forming) PhnN [Aureimonas mangrovi]
MQVGTLFYIVGPSGVGKDTLISGAMAMLAGTGRYVQTKRVITRPAAIGEDHEPASTAAFDAMCADGAFLHHWGAHELRYGLRRTLLEDLAAGRNVLANGSRRALPDLAGTVDRLVVVEITASPALLAERLARRGRESADEIAARIAREVPPLPRTGDLVRIVNDGGVDEAVAALVAALERMASRLVLKRMPVTSARRHTAFLAEDCTAVNASAYAGSGRIEIRSTARPAVPADLMLIEPGNGLDGDEVGLSREAFEKLGLPEGALVSIDRTPSPSSRALLRRKIGGGALDTEEYATLFREIVEQRYPEGETAAFLVKAIQSLDDEETIAVAKARCGFSPRIDWGVPIVVDKHSLGGVPGSRITPIIVPIVAAAGLLMPKTSSRAITSASGTADTMEALCRIDLDGGQIREVVRKTGGCIAWNGKLNHSILDDVVNAVTRPLGLDSNQWSVASILSKKWSAGATHVVIDLPFGPRAKLKSQTEAEKLGRLFEVVGAGLGLIVKAFATDGSKVIGRGLGPSLELRDVLAVLDNAPQASRALRDKALFYAANILHFAGHAPTLDAAREAAEDILLSGEARHRLDAIAAAQGNVSQVAPARLSRSVGAHAAGTIGGIDGWHLGGIARRAGAPHDKSAGVDVLVEPGRQVEAGQPLYTIYASDIASLEEAAAEASREPGVAIAMAQEDALQWTIAGQGAL